jgi:hypothetical protein
LSDGSAKNEAVVIALAVDDPELADRLTTLLADVPGLRLAASGERADISLVGPDHGDGYPDLDQPLTGREVEALTLLAEGASTR